MKKVTLTAMVLLCCALVACSSRPKIEETPTVKRSPISKIAVVAIQDPARLSVDNRGGPLDLLALPGFLITKKIKEERSEVLASTLKNNSLKLGSEMSIALTEQLSGAGYVVELLKDVKRPADDPDEIDYEHLTTDAEAILIARYTDVGLYSGQFSNKFVPRLNLTIEVVAKKDQSDLYSQTIYYGADARKLSEDQIPSGPKYSYSSFDDAIEQQSGLVEGLRAGIQQIASQVAKQMRSQGI